MKQAIGRRLFLEKKYLPNSSSGASVLSAMNISSKTGNRLDAMLVKLCWASPGLTLTRLRSPNVSVFQTQDEDHSSSQRHRSTHGPPIHLMWGILQQKGQAFIDKNLNITRRQLAQLEQFHQERAGFQRRNLNAAPTASIELANAGDII
ncbi:hypothetical protein RRG08_065402 [Elysia crispata]|uniref:Uncharacterized protein n=1 Tax=Elysia crispata TaxID=231223 RepID=A0AAE0ZL37_9GAST|nr:hypothetical protein RRG08_065402 [Elysia crispata]